MNNLNVAKIQLNGDLYEISDGTNLNELLNNPLTKVDLYLKYLLFELLQ